MRLKSKSRTDRCVLVGRESVRVGFKISRSKFQTILDRLWRVEDFWFSASPLMFNNSQCFRTEIILSIAISPLAGSRWRHLTVTPTTSPRRVKVNAGSLAAQLVLKSIVELEDHVDVFRGNFGAWCWARVCWRMIGWGCCEWRKGGVCGGRSSSSSIFLTIRGQTQLKSHQTAKSHLIVKDTKQKTTLRYSFHQLINELISWKMSLFLINELISNFSKSI